VSVTAIVLAGGRADRFGADKLGLALDGVSLLDRAIEAVSQVADEVLLAGPPDLARSSPGIRVVADREPFGGPLVGLAGALAQTSGELAIVVGGDMPRLVPAVLATMLDRLAADPTFDAVILAIGGSARRQVLPLAIRVGPASAVAEARLASGERSLRAFLAGLSTLELAEPEWRPFDPAGDTLADVDTPADLDRLHSHAFEREGGR
jgi:molybdenum cofactor guanylyltransferase